MSSKISPPQLKRLQTLWGLFCSQAQLDPKDREARLHWAADVIGRQVDSFGELSAVEAAMLIDAMQRHLPSELVSRTRPSRRLAQAYGTAGRRGRIEKEVRLVDAETLRVLDALLGSLGWTRERFDAFLRSPKSPVHSGAIRTLAEANRAIWALKNILRHSQTTPGAPSLRRAG